MVEPLGFTDGQGPEPDQTANQLSMPTPMDVVQPSNKTSADRALVFQFSGMFPDKSSQELADSIYNGQEDQLRSLAAKDETNRRNAAMMTHVGNVLNGPIDVNSPEHQWLLKGIQDMKDSNPEAVVEDGYAGKFVNYIKLPDLPPEADNTWVPEAMEQIPEYTEHVLGLGEKFIARNQYANKIAQDAADVAGNEGTFSKLTNIGEDMLTLGFRNELLQRGWQDKSEFKWLLGNSLEEQRAALFSKESDEEFRQSLSTIVSEIQSVDPQVAAAYANAMTGQSLQSLEASNINTMGIYSGAVPAEALFVGGARVGRAAIRGAVEGLPRALPKELANQVDTATQQIVQASLEPRLPANVTAPAAAGNLPQAAAARSASTVIDHIAGRTEEMDARGMESLPSALRTDANTARNDPGRYGAEIGNRLYQDINQVADRTMEIVRDSTNVERLPAMVLSDAANQATEEYVRTHLPGALMNDSVLDVGQAYKSKINNLWYRDLVIGNEKGKYFNSRSEATGYRETFGLPEATAVKATGRKWALMVPSPIDETHPTLWSMRVDLEGKGLSPIGLDFENSRLPGQEGKWHDLLRWVTPLMKTWTPPEEVLSEPMRIARKVAQFGGTNLKAQFKGIAKPILELAKTRGGPVTTDLRKIDTGFTTAKGSTYKINHPGTTIRDKAPRYEPGHVEIPPFERVMEINQRIQFLRRGEEVTGVTPEETEHMLNTLETEKRGRLDQGVQPESGRTVYVRPEDKEKLLPGKNAKGEVRTQIAFADNGDNTYTKMIPTPGKPGGWAAERGLDKIPYSDRPVLGYHPVEFFGPSQRADREVHLMNHVGSPITAIQSSMEGTIKVARSERYSQWKSVISDERTMIDPITGRKGYSFRSPGELESYYMKKFGRLPDKTEIQAYFAYNSFMTVDHLMRNITLRKNMGRLGYQQHQLTYYNSDGQKSVSDWISGKVIDHLPEGDLPVVDITGDNPREFPAGHYIPSVRTYLEDQLKNKGAKVLKLWDPTQKPLRGFGGDDKPIGTLPHHYVIVRQGDMASRDLPWDIIPRRGGGHHEYSAPDWIKQAQVDSHVTGQYGTSKTNPIYKYTHFYNGDVPIMPVAVRAMGKDIATKLNRVREAIHEGMAAKDFTEAMRIHGETRLPMSWEDHLNWYKNGLLRTDEPIYVVEDGKSVSQLPESNLALRYGGSNNTFKDMTKANSDSNKFNVEFNVERSDRDMFTLHNTKGTGRNPLYEMAPADLVDPMESVNRALYRITNTSLMDDVKHSSMYHWLAEAAPHITMNGDPVSTNRLWSSPWYYFNEGKLEGNLDSLSQRNRLEAARYQIKSFAGIASKTDDSMRAISQTIVDSIYNRFGENRFTMYSPYSPNFAQNAVSFLKAAVFHPIIGMFNWTQFVVNSMTYANIYGIAGVGHAAPGAFAATIHQMSRLSGDSEEWLKYWDNAAVNLFSGKSGTMPGIKPWLPGQWAEARKYMIDTGYHLIGNEQTLLQNEFTPKITEHMGQKVLDVGTMPYKAAERNNRFGAWYTAFREFREKNPVGVLTDYDIGKITERANLLTTNMETSSKAAFEKGIGAIPLQFTAYNLRLAEQLLGHRLTGVEKARFLTTNLALFGAAGAGGMALYPFGDLLRRKAMEETEYRPGANFWPSVMMEGVPAAIGAMVTGDGDMSKGHWYDVGTRYGANGLDIIRNALYGDATVAKLIGGPFFGEAGTIMSQSSGLAQAIKSQFSNDPDSRYPFKIEDALDVLRSISSVNTAMQTHYAMSTGIMASRSGTEIETNVGAMDALFMGLTGLKHQDVADISVRHESEDALKEGNLFWMGQKNAQNKYLEKIRESFKAIQNSQPEEADLFLKQANYMLGLGRFNEDQKAKLWSMAVKPMLSLVDESKWQFYVKSAPGDKVRERYETYKAIKEQQGPGQ